MVYFRVGIRKPEFSHPKKKWNTKNLQDNLFLGSIIRQMFVGRFEIISNTLDRKTNVKRRIGLIGTSCDSPWNSKNLCHESIS